MNARNRLAALFAAGALVMAFGAVTSAAPPTYSISVTKSADPASVPPSGGTVEFTIDVVATGTGFFGTVNVADGMAGCTLSGPSGDTDTDDNLDPGETWVFTCTVSDVMPGDENTATVTACHNNSGSCNQSNHDATDTDSVTIGEGQPTEPPATTEPSVPADPTDTPDPDGGEEGLDATVPATDTLLGGGPGRPGDGTWMLVLALGLLLASVVVVSPSKAARQRDR